MKPPLSLRSKGHKKESDKKNGRRIRIDYQRVALALATIIFLSILLSIHLLPNKVSLLPGDTAAEDIRAYRSVRYIDNYETEQLQLEAARAVEQVYDRVPYASSQSARELASIFRSINDSRHSDVPRSSTERAADLREETRNLLGLDVPQDSIRLLIDAPQARLKQVEALSTRLVRAVMDGEVKDNAASISETKALVTKESQESIGEGPYATAAAQLAIAAIRPNLILNIKKTESEKERAMAAVKPVYGYIRSGELIIAKGQPVTKEHIEKFTALGLRQSHIDYKTVLSLSALVSFLVVLVVLYLSKYQPQIYGTTRLLLLLSLVVIVSTFGLKLSGGMLGIKLSGLQLAYIGMMFTTTAGMVLATLLNAQTAVLVVAMLSIVAGLVTNLELRFAASTLMSGVVAIYSVANMRGRADLIRAFVAIAATNVAMIWILGGLFDDLLSDMLVGSVWMLFVIAPAATWLFWYGTWILERPFKLTTQISLLELADTNNPILKRLVVEAPGTYIHSVAVGHLAEAAADAIGADGLFARVASYYHDIGKIRRPQFFVENQRVENIHDRLSPSLSAIVIMSHIKDGQEVAREFKLPGRIVDIISQHHGTSLVQYFYNQVTGQMEPSAALEQQFRYEGPRPKSREAAIIMLADSVEAASRGLAKPTLPALETLVQKVVSDKAQDGQLNDTELTFRDLQVIQQTFVRSLTGTLHARIEYQEAVQAESEGKVANGDSDRQSAEDTGGSGPVGEDRKEAALG